MKKKGLTKKEENTTLLSLNTNRRTKIEEEFPIVGIGASAGGLEALEQFFGKMPFQSGMAFVVVQHLDPKHEGIMPELLQRITPMKVLQASDRLKIKPNHVYVIPPNKSMSILNRALHLFDLVEPHGLRLPIDIFFNSLAQDLHDKSIGIILSGMGSDGSRGVKSIKENFGIVAVQDPASAKFNGMPKSASEAVIPDILATASELPEKLVDFLKFSSKNKESIELEHRNKSNLDKIIILLREHTGHDFSMYKKNTLFRRIDRRKTVHQIDKISNYVRFLQGNPMEIEILFNELLIGVTHFFRDAEVWEFLEQTILPKVINESPRGHVLRAWVPACSTGEEAYSLAIVFNEVLNKLGEDKNLSLQIFATDLDGDAISKARKGYFPKNIETELSPARLSQYFTKEGEGYRINNIIREMIVFAPQNVIKDPPFTKVNLLFCRNMLIYMEPVLQKKLMALFNYSLIVGGFMILGTAETIGNTNLGFRMVNSNLKIYKRIETSSPPELIAFPSSFHKTSFKSNETKMAVKSEENIQSLADQILLQHFSPASVLVNQSGDILYITGRTGKYLEPVAGKANWNIYAMARDGLQQALPGAFRKAKESVEVARVKNIKVGTNGGTQYIDLEVQRLEQPEALKGMFIFVFKDVSEKEQLDISVDNSKTKPNNKRVKELELELQRSYEELQSNREEMQTSQEELKSTNEELQSTNEELQSTNEELTTSKEEMQSLNEELQTVNIELQSKVNDYVRASDDMKNLLNSIEIATLFLDKELNIRRFTDKITTIFKLRTADMGRPFTDLVNDLNYPDIEVHANEVLESLVSIEKAIETSDGRWIKVRIMPYRTIDDRIDGLVMTFADITEAKKLEIELKRANEELKKETRD